MVPQSPIGHYHITTKLGEGGMGAVYRAADTRLNRDVAIKILPDAFAHDADRLARFEREAQVLASLNHPNIAAIYGVEERALVMELVEGVTLAELIARGPVPENEARAIIDQLIDALEYAHEKGIVHRDLKPANIKLTPEARVKVLDFGLAKAMAGEAVVRDPASSPTLTMRATIAGVILGTAAYMAPEQARGQSVDKRADIWAFGVLVYEMLTGRQLFGGPTVSDVVAAVLKEEPDLALLPASMQTLAQHCLAKDPRRRMRDIGDARILLNQSQSVVAASGAQSSPRGKLPWVLLSVVAVLACVLAAGLWRATRPIDRPLIWLSVDLGPDAAPSRDFTVAISPDGTHIVFPVGYAGASRLAIRFLSRPDATPLPGTEGALNPFFSPDGEWVGFSAAGRLKKISIHGGPAVTLCDGIERGATWGEDGYIIAVLGNETGLSRIHENGGAPQPLTTPQNGELTHRWPQIVPSGQAVLFSVNSAYGNWEQANVEGLFFNTSKRKIVQRGGYYGRYVPTGHLVYVRGGSLFGAPFDVDHLEPKGPPATLLEDLASSSFGGGQFDFSRTGTLAYLSGKSSEFTRPLIWLDSDGKSHPLFPRPDAFSSVSLSPDGKRLAITIGNGGGDLWVYDLDREIPTKLTQAGPVLAAIWAPDGKHLVYGQAPGFTRALMWIRADGAGEPQRLADLDGDTGRVPRIPHFMSDDGRHIIFSQPVSGVIQSGGNLFNLTVDLADPEHPKPGTLEPLLKSQVRLGGASISPDGRWIAYSTGPIGSASPPEVFVRPFADGKFAGEGVWQVSSGGGGHPVWSKTGRKLLYVAPDHRVMAADYLVQKNSFASLKPRIWSDRRVGPGSFSGMPFYAGSQPFDTARDGERIVTWESDEQPNGVKVDLHVTLLMNWFDELRRRLPSSGR